MLGSVVNYMLLYIRQSQVSSCYIFFFMKMEVSSCLL